MLALSAKPKQIELAAIEYSYTEHFVYAVTEGYKGYLDDVKIPVIPALLFYGNQHFLDNFIETLSIIRASYTDRHFPGFDWDSATDDEKEEMDKVISERYLHEEEELMADIETVLDHFQLFYIHTDEAYGEGGIEIIINHYNSPLQEVW